MNLNINIINLLFLIFIIPISLVFEGIRRKLMARMQNRTGPSILQPFYDVMKLFEKKEMKQNKIFRTLPLIYLITTFMLFFFAPFPLFNFHLGLLMLILIFAINGAFYTLLGILNSTDGRVDLTRKIFLMMIYDIIFAIGIFTFITFTKIQSMMDFNQEWMILKLPVACISLFIIPLVEIKIKPYETVEAFTEMMGDAETEFSGRELAFFEISKNLKLAFFVFLTSLLFFGFKNLVSFSIICLLILFIMTFIQATTSRYKLNQITNILIVVLIFVIFEFVKINFITW
jgi:formate hydrogenlyase subunit 4